MDPKSTNYDGEKSSYWDLGEEEEEAGAFALSLTCDVFRLAAFKTVVELNIIGIIKNAGSRAHLSSEEIAAKLATDNPAAPSKIRRLLDYLVSQRIFTVAPTTLLDGSVERRYGLAPVCKLLTPNDEDGVSLAHFINNSDMYNSTVRSSLQLKGAILEGGEPFERAHGMSLYEYSGKYPAYQKAFHKAMSDHSTLILKKLLRTYKGFYGLSSLVDVGGGNGATLTLILSHYPTIKGINFDQPHVVADEPLSYPGIEHVGGDMFVSIPKGDAIFLKFICHCFQDEECIKILKNCYDAIPAHGKVIICEYLLPDPNDTSPGITGTSVIQFDICMMVMTGGKERTQKAFEALALAAGFKGFRVVDSAYNVKIMELSKEN